MKGFVQLLGIVIGLVGIGLVLYSVTISIPYVGTITVYPYQIVGAIVLLIGFVTFFIGVAIPEEKQTTTLEETEEEKGQAQLTEFMDEAEAEQFLEEQPFSCGTCLFFGNFMLCLMKEKNAKAVPCVYYRSRKARQQKISP